jgi:4-amino-4-deoxy-L-arabinose transferase-like glycosyltransferase
MSSKEQSQGRNAERNRRRLLSWLFLAVIIIVTAGLRFRLLDVPFERDEGEYAYAGQLMLQGIPPYSLVYNMKFPGIYEAYALIFAIFGQTHTAIHLGLLIINAVTILLVFLLTRFLIDSFAGVFAAAAFAVLSVTKSVQGLFANAEHFVLLFALVGILLLLLALDRKSLVLLLVASVLLGTGFLMKQHGIAFIIFAGLYLLFSQLRRKPFELKSFLVRVALFAVGVLLPFGITCFILWRVGVFEKFWFWTFVYAREYVSIKSIPVGLQKLKLTITYVIRSAVMIWILTGIGLVTLFLKKNIRSQIPFIVGFLVFSFLATCPGLYFRPHYFVLLLPAIALLSGVGLFGIREAIGRQEVTFRKDLIAALLGLVIIFHSLFLQRDYLLAEDVNKVSRMTYGMNPFPESLKIAEFIKANSSSEDTIAILGSEPQIFFYADRRSATSYVYVYPLMEPQPYALQMQQEMIQQIESTKPKFL